MEEYLVCRADGDNERCKEIAEQLRVIRAVEGDDVVVRQATVIALIEEWLARRAEGDLGKTTLAYIELDKLYQAYPDDERIQRMGEIVGLKPTTRDVD